MRIPTLEPDPFMLHQMPGKYTAAASLPRNELFTALNSIAHAMSASMDRPCLHGVNVELFGGVATFTALDGYRLASYVANTGRTENDCNINIPAETVNIAKAYKGACGIMTDGKYMQINDSGGEYSLVSRLYDGEYVNWRGIMPNEFATTATVSVSALAPIAKNAIVTGGKGVVTLHIGTESVYVETDRDGMKSPLRELSAETNGHGLDIAFNPQYLHEALRELSTDNATIRCNTSISPALIKDGALTLLILPVKINREV